MNKENLRTALNKETLSQKYIFKDGDGLYCYLTGEKLNNNWVEINLQVELAMMGVLYSEMFD